MVVNYGFVKVEKLAEGGYALRIMGPHSEQEHWFHFDDLLQLNTFASAIDNAVTAVTVEFFEQQKVT